MHNRRTSLGVYPRGTSRNGRSDFKLTLVPVAMVFRTEGRASGNWQQRLAATPHRSRICAAQQSTIGSWQILNLIAMLGDRKLVPRQQPPGVAPHSVDFDPVATAQIAHMPVAVQEFEQAVPRRDIGKLEDDVAMSVSTDEQFWFEQRNRIAEFARHQLTLQTTSISD
jgi:hypothetical protein